MQEMPRKMYRILFSGQLYVLNFNESNGISAINMYDKSIVSAIKNTLL